MPTIELTIPKPLDWQRRVVAEASRFNVVCIGRRAGKTELGKQLCVTPDVLAYPVGWFSPTYKDMIEVWRDLSDVLFPITKRASAAERRLEFITGGVLEFWSLDNPKAGRSRRYKRIVVDEAAFVSNLYDTWTMALRPTLADFNGDAWFFSTPKGHNGFYQLYSQAGYGGEWARWQMPTTVNPYIKDSEIEAMKATMPEWAFEQEINAAFLGGGGTFRNVRESATAVVKPPEEGRQYIIGVDVASQQDFTVVTVLDIESKSMVYLDRFNRIDYPALEQRIRATWARYNQGVLIIESNSIGLPVIDHLRLSGLPIQSFTTTNATKANAIQSLQAAFEHGEIQILDDPVLIAELQAFEGKRLETGMRYSAPDGMHDDCVMSLAIAWHGIAGRMPAFL